MNSPPTLLYVEDSLDDRVLFKKACEQGDARFRLVLVNHGKEAVDYLSAVGRYSNRQEFPLPDAVLLDVKMPLLDGFGVLRWIRKQASFKDLPVFIFTSSYQHADVERAYAEKATAFFTKPSEFRGLVRLAATLFDCFTETGLRTDHLDTLPQYRPPNPGGP